MMLGEAPGEAEDIFGTPFVGPAGQELDRWIERAIAPLPVKPRILLSNLIACIPRDEQGQKVHEPEIESVEACTPRLLDLVRIAQPKLVICVGKISSDWTDPKFRNNIRLVHADGGLIDRVSIDHPAKVLRIPIAHRHIAIQRAVIQIRTAIEAVMHF